MSSNPTEDQQGLGFACFRSHSNSTGIMTSWIIPGFADLDKQTNQGICACECEYIVSDQYHWHDHNRKCHNRVECK